MSHPPLWRPEGLRLKPVYHCNDLEGLEHLHSLPGKAPFVRGPYSSMYPQKPWTVRQYTGFAGAEASNQRLRQRLAEGATGLSLAFDLPTHRGYDSNDPQWQADVGKAGVAIDSVEDMAELLDGIALDQVSVSLTMNGAVLPVLAAFIVAAEESGVAPALLSGTIQNDILKEFTVRNTYIFAPQPSMRITMDVIAYLNEHVPRFNPISVSGYHFQEAGADAVLELALTLVNARTYAEQVQKSGLDLQGFCERISFFFGIGNDFFSEIAKCRAARLLWSEITQALGIQSDKGQALRMHCQTSGWSLSAQDPLNNVTRTTVQAMAAVFGGTQSLHTNAWDEALALPSEASSRLASNTQHILQQETGLCDVVDPWAGSYMMESLTAQMAVQVRQRMAEIDAQGGVFQSIASGWISQAIHLQALATQVRLDGGIQRRVGASEQVHAAPESASAMDSQALRARQCQRLLRLRLMRDTARVEALLDSITECARSCQGNLLQVTVAAIRARATLGECTQALEKVWPRFRQDLSFHADFYGPSVSEHPGWAQVGARLSTFVAHEARPPRILLTKLGQDGHDRGIRLIAAALADAGFEVRLLPLFQTPIQLLESLDEENQVDLIGISSLAGGHQELLTELLSLLKKRELDISVVVGGIIPEADARQLLDLGVKACFGAGQEMIEIIEKMVDLLVHPHLRPGTSNHSRSEQPLTCPTP
ncbi:methylmalonyl-CoA mutase [Pseudomonas sp. PD9R]|uniref:methylmalonyl-CoA mutase n=1 Tax=Pseudomonas sp. PD9R TaxID=2853534 RepID=UPI001C466C0F|nr:methylmalonyl-CoA mutase [Pseudomonas sp. PD9R]MBV6823432.1 methylmalonyl-CoA mutase [Pseudomonas sp. PD9R]